MEKMDNQSEQDNLKNAWDDAYERVMDSGTDEESSEVMKISLLAPQEINDYIEKNEKTISPEAKHFLQLSIQSKLSKDKEANIQEHIDTLASEIKSMQKPEEEGSHEELQDHPFLQYRSNLNEEISKERKSIFSGIAGLFSKYKFVRVAPDGSEIYRDKEGKEYVKKLQFSSIADPGFRFSHTFAEKKEADTDLDETQLPPRNIVDKDGNLWNLVYDEKRKKLFWEAELPAHNKNGKEAALREFHFSGKDESGFLYGTGFDDDLSSPWKHAGSGNDYS